MRGVSFEHTHPQFVPELFCSVPVEHSTVKGHGYNMRMSWGVRIAANNGKQVGIGLCWTICDGQCEPIDNA